MLRHRWLPGWVARHLRPLSRAPESPMAIGAVRGFTGVPERPIEFATFHLVHGPARLLAELSACIAATAPTGARARVDPRHANLLADHSAFLRGYLHEQHTCRTCTEPAAQPRPTARLRARQQEVFNRRREAATTSLLASHLAADEDDRTMAVTQIAGQVHRRGDRFDVVGAAVRRRHDRIDPRLRHGRVRQALGDVQVSAVAPRSRTTTVTKRTVSMRSTACRSTRTS